ncbi:MAG: helix-turn-helix domain-containing protein [Coriobacteriia bacterium]|nr:helix-turn-helix domain-containing protein [Coriobacteriia bacterium]
MTTLDDINANTMTLPEVMEYLNVSKQRVMALRRDGMITKLKGGGFYRPSVEAYKIKRGDKKAGRYPKAESRSE